MSNGARKSIPKTKKEACINNWVYIPQNRLDNRISLHGLDLIRADIHLILYDVAPYYVSAWEPLNYHDLEHMSWVESVLQYTDSAQCIILTGRLGPRLPVSRSRSIGRVLYTV